MEDVLHIWIYQNGFNLLQRHKVGGKWDFSSCIWGSIAPIEAQILFWQVMNVQTKENYREEFCRKIVIYIAGLVNSWGSNRLTKNYAAPMSEYVEPYGS